MTHEARRLNQQRHSRIARVKRILRWMPRRSNMHRYPVLRWFKSLTPKRPEIWSFRVKRVVPALYGGFVLSLLPLYGVQLPLSVILAWLIRANLPVFFSLQFITNPFTLLPIYFACFQVGRIFLALFGMEVGGISIQEMNGLILQVAEGSLWHQLYSIWKVWLVTAMGGIILGTFFGSISSAIYKLAAYEVNISYHRLKQLQSNGKAGPSTDKPEQPLPLDPPS
ncbi:MAG: hypothetical protein RL648_1128 [Verrucomicrobiota bacterium]|jgi:uncharacterized protein (DUF2062 family)